MGVKGVVFDLDGTLTYFNVRMREAREAFLRRIKSLGVGSRLLTPDRPLEIIIRYLERRHGLSRDLLMRLADESFTPYELEAAETAELRPEARLVLDRLKSMGYRLGIASNNCRICVDRVLRRLGLEGYFAAVVTRNDVRRLKPHEEMIVEAVGRLGIEPREAVYVGDSIVDVVAGRRAGALVALLRGGSSSTMLPARTRPDYVLKDLEDLIQAIEGERSF